MVVVYFKVRDIKNISLSALNQLRRYSMSSIPRFCSIENCHKRHDSHGYCSAHAAKFNKYGDPLFSINQTHGLSTIPEYWVYAGMKRRCYNKNEKAYSNYGGRGIKVCDKWLKSFESFLKDMGKRPSPKHSIERRDVNGNYEPSNCYWATDLQQANNTRANHKVTINGITKNISQWRKELNMPSSTYQNRINRGWSVKDALTTPRMIQYSKFKD
jgi:hypothetical protein